MRMVKLQRELDFEPGSQYSYSNTGYNLLAAIVAKVSGTPFPEWIDAHSFKPLDMHAVLVQSDSAGTGTKRSRVSENDRNRHAQ